MVQLQYFFLFFLQTLPFITSLSPSFPGFYFHLLSFLHICIYLQSLKGNLFTSYSAVSMYVFGGDNLALSHNRCGLPWGGPLLMLLVFLSGLQFVMQCSSFIGFLHPAWHTLRCHPCSSHVWVVMFLTIYDVNSVVVRRHSLRMLK